MLSVYPAIFHKEDGSYWVEFPDLEGCQTWGEDLVQTMELAAEALGLYIAAKQEGNLAVPPARDIVQLTPPEGCFASYVCCDASKFRKDDKPVKKTLTIPAWLNEEAEKRNINFSGVLRQALISKLD